MNRILRVTVAGLLLAMVAVESVGAEPPMTVRGELVALPPMTVYAGWLRLRYDFDAQQRVAGVFVEDVTPGSPLKEAGLRRNDELVEIDGVTVRGLEIVQLLELSERTLKQGERREFVFRWVRGWFKREERRLKFVLVATAVPNGDR